MYTNENRRCKDRLYSCAFVAKFFFLQHERDSTREFPHQQATVVIEELERLAHIVLTHVQTQTPRFLHLEFDAAAVIDSVFGFAIAVVRPGLREGRELNAAGRERSNAEAFGRGIQEEIVEALMRGNADVLCRDGLCRSGLARQADGGDRGRRRRYSGSAIRVAEFMSHEPPRVQCQSEPDSETVRHAVRAAGGIDIGSTDVGILRSENRLPKVYRSFKTLRETCRGKDEDQPMQTHALQCTTLCSVVLITAFRGAEMDEFAVDSPGYAEGGRHVRAANRISFQLAACHYGRISGRRLGRSCTAHGAKDTA